LTILERMEYTVDKMEETVQIVQNLLPEILLALKESNRKTRKVGIDAIKFF
jgi:transcription initiation factor IIE alpha subunit